MRVFKLFLVFSLMFSGLFVSAEPAVYVRSNGQFVAGGNEYPRGFWVPVVSNAESFFATNAIALENYKEHVRYGRWFGILNWGALGAYLTYAAIASGNDNYDAGVGLTVFFVPWVTGIFMGAKSQKALMKAMNIMNGVPPTEARYQILPTRSLAQNSNVTAPIFAWSF